MADKISEMLPGVQKNVLLKDYTTYKIGGPARYFFVAKTKEDLIKAVESAKKIKLPIFILGGGSNLLVSGKGFNGLVVKIDIKNINFQEDEVAVGDGTDLAKLSYALADAGLSGLEWATGIPQATVGGAIYGHAQAFGIKMSDAVKSVEAFDLKTLEIKTLTKEQCKFSLKNSIFKKNKNLVIVSANLIFQKKSSDEIKDKINEFLEYRKNNHPSLPSAGSTFVNPEIIIKNKKLLEKFPELSAFNQKGTIPVAYLIQKAGLQGKKIGGAQISEKHANFIVNLGDAKAKDVLALIKLAKQKVKKTFGINLETEVQLIGF